MPEQPRVLGFAALWALGVNGIVGVGIFFAPSEVATSVPGRLGILVYPATAAALLPIAVTFAILGGRFDVDGGPFVWARAAFGPRFAFFVGWMTYASALFSTAAVASGLGQHLAPALDIQGVPAQRGFAITCAFILAAVASTGLRPSAFVWSGITVLKLVPLAALLVLAAVSSSVSHSAPAVRTGGVDFWRAMLIVVFACQGFEVVPLLAGSAWRSSRSIPSATILSLILAAVLYTALHAVCVAVVPGLSASPTPLVSAAAALGGRSAERVVAIGANISAIGIAFGMFVLTPRYLAALAVPDALGPWIGREDARRVPQRALWITTVPVAVIVALGELGELFAVSSVAVLAQYTACAFSLAALARRGTKGLGPRHLWPAGLTAVGVLLSAQGAALGELAAAFGVLLVGAGLLALGRRPGVSAGR